MTQISSTHPIPPQMEKTINVHTASLGGAGILGGLAGPGADLPVIAGSWVTMTLTLADQAGHDMDYQTVKKICLAVGTGAGAFLAGTKIAATAAGWIGAFFTAGTSLLISAAGNAALNAAFTRAYGRACARYFVQTSEIETIEVIVNTLIALIGIEMGINMGNCSNIS